MMDALVKAAELDLPKALVEAEVERMTEGACRPGSSAA